MSYQRSAFSVQLNRYLRLIRPKLDARRWQLDAKKGYSLLELLIVIALVGTIGVITSQVFIIGLRSQAKSEILKEVKQNGDYALQVMDTIIRNAVNIDEASCNANTQDITITTSDGASVTFDCTTPRIASVSGDPSITLYLTSSKVSVSSCNIRVVCPTPPTSPKYVFFNYTISQVGTQLAKEQQASVEFQSTVSLRKYE